MQACHSAARRARWWTHTISAAEREAQSVCERLTQAAHRCTVSALAASVLERWSQVSVQFLDQDTPDEDEGAEEVELCRVALLLPTGEWALDLRPAGDRTASVSGARLVSTLAKDLGGQVLALEAAVRESRAALDAERAKYRDVRCVCLRSSWRRTRPGRPSIRLHRLCILAGSGRCTTSRSRQTDLGGFEGDP